MVQFLRKICWPVLRFFESGDEAFVHKAMNRKILIALACLFCLLSGVIAWVAIANHQWGGVLPAVIFMCVGLVSLIVGALGSDRAVAKIWGSK